MYIYGIIHEEYGDTMKTCRVCSSLHREEYEKMKLVENRTAKDIHEYSMKYNEEIGYYSFVRHFRHTKVQLDELKKSSKLRNKIVEESIQKDIAIVQRIQQNLDICDQLIGGFVDEGKLRELDPDDFKLLFTAMSQCRLVIDQMLKWRKDVNVQTNTTDLFEKILFCMNDFPLEQIVKFKERWEAYDTASE